MPDKQMVNSDYYRNRAWGLDSKWPSEYGEHWSAPWGSVDNQWRLTIEPRIRPWKDRTVVEVGCGRGRWARFFYDYIGLDLNESCCAYTAQRWGKYCVVAQRDQQWPIPDHIAGLVFSWDSLVYSSSETIDAVLGECSRVLAFTGAAVLHYTGTLRTGCGDLRLHHAERIDWPTDAADGWIATYVLSGEAIVPTIVHDSPLRSEMAAGIGSLR
jgi:ubiquinone/menaquinone biosynthesis C-methylase UbiE